MDTDIAQSREAVCKACTETAGEHNDAPRFQTSGDMAACRWESEGDLAQQIILSKRNPGKEPALIGAWFDKKPGCPLSKWEA